MRRPARGRREQMVDPLNGGQTSSTCEPFAPSPLSGGAPLTTLVVDTLRGMPALVPPAWVRVEPGGPSAPWACWSSTGVAAPWLSSVPDHPRSGQRDDLVGGLEAQGRPCP